MTTLLKAAQEYAARGWRVFALTGRKTPFGNCDACAVDHRVPEEMEACECLTCHGFYAATTDPRRIKAMFSTSRPVCLAVRTGAVSGLAVVDIDFREWTPEGAPATYDPAWTTLSSLDADRLLPGTLMSSSPSGGLHLYYAHPGGYLMSGAGKYGPGIDSKADGGYVVAPPSVNRRGERYQWTPDGRHDHELTPLHLDLVERLRPPQVVPQVRPAAPPTAATTHNRLRGLIDTVLRAQNGERNDLLHWAATKAGEMLAHGEVDEHTVVDVLQDAAQVIGLPPNEAGDGGRGTIGSGLRRGRRAGLGVVA